MFPRRCVLYGKLLRLNNLMVNRTLLLATLVAALMPRPAAADELVVSRAADGTVVISDRPLTGPTPIHRVEGAAGYVTTRGAEVRGSQFDALVLQYAGKHALEPGLVRAVIQIESGFNPRARSPKGAMGLMQLMPQTARDLGVRDAYDPEDNIRGGTKYLRQLMDKYNGQVYLALAAYNAGPGAVDKYGKTIPPYRETREYVGKVQNVAGKMPAVVQADNSARFTMYRWIVIKNDRAIPQYSNVQPPAGVEFEVVKRR
jgi:hypothetical protein